MIVLASPKGWTGPKMVDGLQIEGTFRAHQVPLSDPAHASRSICKQLEDWLRSYRPRGAVRRRTAGCGRSWPRSRPTGARRMGANPHANGGMLLRDLRMPDFRDYAVDVPRAGRAGHRRHARARAVPARRRPSSTSRQRNFRIFGPDETLSNGLEAVFEATERQWDAATVAGRRVPRAAAAA